MALIVGVTVSAPLSVLAQELPHTFTSGETAHADAVNENFATLESAVFRPGRTLFRSGNGAVLIAGPGTLPPGGAAFLGTMDADGTNHVIVSFSPESGGGAVAVAGPTPNPPNASHYVVLRVVDGSDPERSHGEIQIRNHLGTAIVLAGQSPSDGGGLLEVCNANGTECSRITSGQKNFIVAHPRRSGQVIRHTALEGPEAAIYARGTAHLRQGRSTVQLPEHFRRLAAAEGMSVTLTPRDSGSLGLGRAELSPARLVVVELDSGQGNYAFDYVVRAVRRGFEDYEVFVDRKVVRAGLVARSAQ